jgi:hypothetical protein
MMLRASSSSPTPLTLQAVAAIVLVAALVLLVVGILYLVLAGSVAWALMLLQGLMWLAFQGLHRSWTALRGRSAAELAAETAPESVLHPPR